MLKEVVNILGTSAIDFEAIEIPNQAWCTKKQYDTDDETEPSEREWYKYTPLQISVAKGDESFESTKFLISKGANYNVIDAAGLTLLHLASAVNGLKTLEFLINIGDIDPYVKEIHGYTAYKVVKDENDRKEVAALL